MLVSGRRAQADIADTLGFLVRDLKAASALARELGLFELSVTLDDDWEVLLEWRRSLLAS
jgi:hypothetical protein